MNYEAERAMNQKRLRAEGEPGHGVVQGNGLPLNYIDNGHQIPYQPYAGAYNTHYPPPDAFSPYGPPPPGGYAPQNLSYVPPAHQNYPHHQSFPQQPPQAQLHMAQTHMGMLGGYDVGVHKPWAPPPEPKPEPKKPEIKLEPDTLKRVLPDQPIDNMGGGDLDQPKIKIKTDIFKPEDMEKARDPNQIMPDLQPKPVELQKEEVQPNAIIGDGKPLEKPGEVTPVRPIPTATPDTSACEDRKPFSSPDLSSPGKPAAGLEPKKRGRPKGSTNKPKALVPRPAPRPAPRPTAPAPRPRAPPYQYAVRPFRKDFSGIQFRRRWSDECLDSSHIPNEVYFGDVPVSTEVLFNYYDANAERERLAAAAAQIAAQKAAAAKLAAAKLQARGVLSSEVTTVDSSSDDDSSGSDGSDSDDSDEQDTPLKKAPAKPKAAKPPKTPGGGGAGGRRGRPPVPPELRQPGITDMKKFCKAAGIRFDYKKLVDGCTKNKERVQKMMDLLTEAGLEGKPTLEKCRAIKQAKLDKKEKEKQAKKEAKVKHKEESGAATPPSGARRMTRGATGATPRQRIVISSDEEDATPAARRALSRLRSSVNTDSDSD